MITFSKCLETSGETLAADHANAANVSPTTSISTGQLLCSLFSVGHLVREQFKNRLFKDDDNDDDVENFGIRITLFRLKCSSWQTTFFLRQAASLFAHHFVIVSPPPAPPFMMLSFRLAPSQINTPRVNIVTKIYNTTVVLFFCKSIVRCFSSHARLRKKDEEE